MGLVAPQMLEGQLTATWLLLEYHCAFAAALDDAGQEPPITAEGGITALLSRQQAEVGRRWASAEQARVRAACEGCERECANKRQ